MTPVALALLISLVEEAIKIEPSLAAEISALFARQNPTPQDWMDLRARVLGESFAALAPNAAANLAPEKVETVTDKEEVATDETPAPEVASVAAPEIPAANHTREDGTTVQVFNA